MTQNIVTKDTIRKYTTDEDIYKKYLKINDIPKGNISSIFSKDENPSFNLYWNSGILKFKCNSTGKNGDVFQFVAYLENLDCKTQFNEVLNIIAKHMIIDLQIANTDTESKYPFEKFNKAACISKNTIAQLHTPLFCKTYSDKKTAKKLSVTTRLHTNLDLKWWGKFGVEENILQKYQCRSISSYCWSGKKPIYTKTNAVAFAFELLSNFKLYIPRQTEHGIFKNVLPPFSNGIYGYEQLGTEKNKTIIICEGEKDVIVAASRGFSAVTFGSGAINPKELNIEALQNRCSNLLVCFDTDQTGITGMQNLISKYPTIRPLYLPINESINGYDIADYFQEHTTTDFQKLIDLTLKSN